jgi:prophage regulatory protein
MPETISPRPTRLLEFRDLRSRCGIIYTRQHLRRMQAAGEFPARVQISPGRVAWLEHEVEDWIRERAAARPSACAPDTGPHPIAAAPHGDGR